MLFNAVVFQAFAATLAIQGASAHSHRRARRADLEQVVEKRAADPFSAIAEPVGSLASSLSIVFTQDLAFNTMVSSIAAQVSSAITTIAPVVSVVTQIFPVSQTTASPVPTTAPAPAPTTETPPPPPATTEAPPPPPPSPTTEGCGPAATSTAFVTVTKTETVTSTVVAPTETPAAAAASPSAEATCGPYALPCALHPVASVISSVVPTQTFSPELNSAVSQVAAAVSSANPQFSTPKEIFDNILPFPIN
ncbi:hypothetical protein RQP46_008318 [Phenoliferia psychrophenolica]